MFVFNVPWKIYQVLFCVCFNLIVTQVEEIKKNIKNILNVKVVIRIVCVKS